MPTACRLMALTSTVVCSAIAMIAADSAKAQSAQQFSLQASGIYVSVFGDAYEGMKNGPGVEGQLRFTPGAWSFGVGGQLSMHATDEPGFSDYLINLRGVFFEPRRVIDVGSSHVAPYLSARLAFLRQSIDLTLDDDMDEITLKAQTSGSQINAGGGLLFRLSKRVNLDLGATFGVIQFGDVEVSIPGQGKVNLGEGGSNGQNLVLRAGLAIGFGK